MILLSVLADFNNAVVWMVSSRPLILKPSSPRTKSLLTVPSAPFTLGITVTFTFPNFFQFPSNVEVLIFFFAFFQFYNVMSRDSKVRNSASSLFLLTIMRFNHLAGIRWSVCILKSQGSLFVSFSWADSGLCIYQLFVWSNLDFLPNSQWITFPTLPCLVFLSVLVCCIRLLCDWSFCLSPHNQHLLFCCVLSILALIYCSL